MVHAEVLRVNRVRFVDAIVPSYRSRQRRPEPFTNLRTFLNFRFHRAALSGVANFWTGPKRRTALQTEAGEYPLPMRYDVGASGYGAQKERLDTVCQPLESLISNWLVQRCLSWPYNPSPLLE